MKKAETVSIIIPAYNEGESIGGVIRKIFQIMDKECEVIIVDDGSSDGTAEEAEQAGGKVIKHPYNKGNGAAIKTGIRNASGEIIILMDGDGQHNPEDIPTLVSLLDKYDMVVGARISDSESQLHRRIANKIYNLLASYIAGRKIPDLTSGFRAIKTSILKKFLYLLPNTFSYPSTITLSFMKAGYSVYYQPVKVSKRAGKSKISLLKDGVRFFLIISKVATLFSPLRVFLPASLIIFLSGIGYYIYTFYTAHRFTNMSLLLLVAGVMLFLLGLISEQIAQLRYDRSED